MKSRDFVNLRCWKLINDSHVIENFSLSSSINNLNIVEDVRDGNNVDQCDTKIKNVNERVLKKSASEVGISGDQSKFENGNALSKSLGAADVHCASDDNDDDNYSDAQTEVQPQETMDQSKNVFVSAAISVDYANCPPTSKYIRGNNIVSCWAMRPVEGDDLSCYFEWLLCIDLKGSLPKYVLNTVSI